MRGGNLEIATLPLEFICTAEFEIRAIKAGETEDEFIDVGAASAPWTGSGDVAADNAKPAVGGSNMMLCDATNGADDVVAAVAAAAAAAVLGRVGAGVTTTRG